MGRYSFLQCYQSIKLKFSVPILSALSCQIPGTTAAPGIRAVPIRFLRGIRSTTVALLSQSSTV